jgi:serine protease Do
MYEYNKDNDNDNNSISLNHQLIDNTLNKAPVISNNSYYRESINPKKKKSIIFYACLILIVSILSSTITSIIITSRLPKASAETSTTSGTSKNQNGSVLNSLVKTSYENGLTIPEIVKKVTPSIVGIKVTVSNQRQKSLFGYNFNNNPSSQAEGSGIVLNTNGYIMTNYHVVESADPKKSSTAKTTLEVVLSDERTAEAKFIGGDSLNDLAVIKIDLKNLTAAELGDSSAIQTGDNVIAIGNPLGLKFAGSVTAGIISAANRTMDTGERTQSYIQTDAAINSGNSGGALVNANGQVIGINSIKIASSGVEGLGFAIPINTVKPIVEDLVKNGRVTGRPLLGISGQEITQIIAQQYDMPEGIYIAEVSTGSGAEKAGIKKGDVLTKVDNKKISTMSELNDIKIKHKAGDTLDVTVNRDGKEINLKITLTEDTSN